MQPQKVREPAALARIREAAPEAIVVVAFGQLLPRELLELPGLGCLNVHASLLPKYRGAAPIHWALIHGERDTGVSIIRLVEAMDAGPILLQRPVPIAPEETAGELTGRLATLGATALIEALEGLAEGRLTPVPQDERLASYAPRLTPEIGCLDFANGAEALVRKVRGLSPDPGAYTFIRGRRVKILEARVVGQEARGASPGTVVQVRPGEGLVVAAGQGAVLVRRLQPEGRRVMTAEEFARGYGKRSTIRFGAAEGSAGPGAEGPDAS